MKCKVAITKGWQLKCGICSYKNTLNNALRPNISQMTAGAGNSYFAHDDVPFMNGKKLFLAGNLFC
jgi:hypothetical protein